MTSRHQQSTGSNPGNPILPRSALPGLGLAVLGLLPEGAAEPTCRHLRRRRLDRRGHPPGPVPSPPGGVAGSAPAQSIDRGRRIGGGAPGGRRRGLDAGGVVAGGGLLLILVELVTSPELAGQEAVVPHQPRRALPPERDFRSLQPLHHLSLSLSLSLDVSFRLVIGKWFSMQEK